MKNKSKNKIATYDDVFDPKNDPKFSKIMKDFLDNPYLESNQIKFSNYIKDTLGLDSNIDNLIEELASIKKIALKTTAEFNIDCEGAFSW